MRFAACAVPLLALLAACSQSDAPSDKVGQAAEELVGAVIETPAPEDALGPFAPRNDCASLTGAPEFLAMLRAAVAARDTDVLVALAANDVKLGFGGGDGAARLRENLAREGTTLWQELAALTAMGCAINAQGGITMPWYFAQETGGDPFETYIATGDEVIVHEGPAEESPRIATLNWEAVDVVLEQEQTAIAPATMDGDEDGDSWTRIRPRAASGEEVQEGYVRASELRSVVAYRLIASSRNGRWRITALLAGD